MRKPMSGAASGRRRHTTITTMIGKMIFSSLDTGRSCVILMERSFFVVKSFISGGCIIGISAI